MARSNGWTERRLGSARVEAQARDFDAVRDMLAEEVRLELVARSRMTGKREVSNYFHNYGRTEDWHLIPGLVDRRPAILVQDHRDPSGKPGYFVLLQWAGEGVLGIRDFRYARYVMADAELSVEGARAVSPVASLPHSFR